MDAVADPDNFIGGMIIAAPLSWSSVAGCPETKGRDTGPSDGETGDTGRFVADPSRCNSGTRITEAITSRRIVPAPINFMFDLIPIS